MGALHHDAVGLPCVLEPYLIMAAQIMAGVVLWCVPYRFVSLCVRARRCGPKMTGAGLEKLNTTDARSLGHNELIDAEGRSAEGIAAKELLHQLFLAGATLLGEVIEYLGAKHGLGVRASVQGFGQK